METNRHCKVELRACNNLLQPCPYILVFAGCKKHQYEAEIAGNTVIHNLIPASFENGKEALKDLGMGLCMLVLPAFISALYLHSLAWDHPHDFTLTCILYSFQY